MQKDLKVVQLTEVTLPDVLSTHAFDPEQDQPAGPLIEHIQDKEFSPKAKPQPEDSKRVALDPNRCSTYATQRKRIRLAEFEYFNKMTRVQMFNIGVERVSEPPKPCGTSAAAATTDMTYFAVASRSGVILLWSALDCRLKGVARVLKPIVEL